MSETVSWDVQQQLDKIDTKTEELLRMMDSHQESVLRELQASRQLILEDAEKKREQLKQRLVSDSADIPTTAATAATTAATTTTITTDADEHIATSVKSEASAAPQPTSTSSSSSSSSNSSGYPEMEDLTTTVATFLSSMWAQAAAATSPPPVLTPSNDVTSIDNEKNSARTFPSILSRLPDLNIDNGPKTKLPSMSSLIANVPDDPFKNPLPLHHKADQNCSSCQTKNHRSFMSSSQVEPTEAFAPRILRDLLSPSTPCESCKNAFSKSPLNGASLALPTNGLNFAKPSSMPQSFPPSFEERPSLSSSEQKSFSSITKQSMLNLDNTSLSQPNEAPNSTNNAFAAAVHVLSRNSAMSHHHQHAHAQAIAAAQEQRDCDKAKHPEHDQPFQVINPSPAIWQSEKETITSLAQLQAALKETLDTWKKLQSRNSCVKVFQLGTGEDTAAVWWQQEAYMSGPDVMKCILLYMTTSNLTLHHRRKFEEGVFSDLRSLKIGHGSVVEERGSRLLTYLHSQHRLRTQKRQKIFLVSEVISKLPRLCQDAADRERFQRQQSDEASNAKPIAIPAKHESSRQANKPSIAREAHYPPKRGTVFLMDGPMKEPLRRTSKRVRMEMMAGESPQTATTSASSSSSSLSSSSSSSNKPSRHASSQIASLLSVVDERMEDVVSQQPEKTRVHKSPSSSRIVNIDDEKVIVVQHANVPNHYKRSHSSEQQHYQQQQQQQQQQQHRHDPSTVPTSMNRHQLPSLSSTHHHDSEVGLSSGFVFRPSPVKPMSANSNPASVSSLLTFSDMATSSGHHNNNNKNINNGNNMWIAQSNLPPFTWALSSSSDKIALNPLTLPLP